MKLRAGIVGPRRRRNGTGPYVARLLAEAGSDIVGVVGSEFGTSQEAAGLLYQNYGAPVTPYGSIEELLREASLDVLAICSPAECHLAQLRIALAAGVHVFCEKPLTWSGLGREGKATEELVERFRAARLILHHNTQWMYTLTDFARIHQLNFPLRPRSLRVELSPPSPGMGMIVDAGPHALSLAVALGIQRIQGTVDVVWRNSNSQVDVRFVACTLHRELMEVTMSLSFQPLQPRPAAYELDSLRVDREIELPSYRIAFRVGHRLYPIVDPLRRSVDGFLHRVQDTRASFVEECCPITTMRLFDRIWGAFVQSRSSEEWQQMRERTTLSPS